MSVFNYMYSFIHKPPAVQSLEPMCCMIRLAMLAFREVGTKISINNNIITIIQPSLIQGTVRWTHGDTRQDLHHLLHPIVKAIELYDINIPYIFNIFKYTSMGLSRLKSSYNDDSSIICHSLIHYISIVDKALEAKLTKKPDADPSKKPDTDPSKKPDTDPSKKPDTEPIKKQSKKQEVEQKKPEVEQKKPEVEQKKPETDIRERSISIDTDLTNILYKNFKELWTEDQLLLINNLLEESFRHSKESNSYLDAIDTIVKVKEANACEIINNTIIT
jgi:hypothetical protein